ncbi:SWI/SNF and RSC complex subunit Ssr1 [Extremus antarcticus]|uniref:SWI/SNF and RSC complex subunit Ssr1 n=1 Tax=Extremus antarcticus TaxID=702011 RepID=A0AAJ0G9Z2_9PEZI|nr:SWI/SNF and RSC complex subunit Ssr1 [Extremus antarcticus]
MRFSTLAAFLPLATTAVLAAQTPALPACAQLCFLRAIGETSCGATDYYCQCTEGAKAIQKSAIPCLCANAGTDGGCSAAEMMQVQKASNDICVAALSSSSETYTPVTATNACAAVAATGTKSPLATTTTATTTGGTAGTTGNTQSASAGAVSSSTTGNGAPAVTNMAMVGFAGLVMAAL